MSVSEFKPLDIFNRLERLAKDYVEAKYLADQLEDAGKVLLAKLSLEADGKSIEQRKAQALVSEEYAKHSAGYQLAAKKALRAKLAYQNAVTYADCLRTEQSTQRAAMMLS